MLGSVLSRRRDGHCTGRKELYGVPGRHSAADGAEAKALCAQAIDWALLDDAKRIESTCRFRNCREALGVVERAALGEEEAHDPEIRFGWDFATVSLQTKITKGLHENEFIMGAKVDRLAAQ